MLAVHCAAVRVKLHAKAVREGASKSPLTDAAAARTHARGCCSTCMCYVRNTILVMLPLLQSAAGARFDWSYGQHN
eukprot:364222-Chlamydomonas_euryale.AAC.7